MQQLRGLPHHFVSRNDIVLEFDNEQHSIIQKNHAKSWQKYLH